MYDLTLPVKESHSSVVMEPPGDYGERFVNPLSDFGFKRIFGNASNKRILKSFVNAVLNGEHVIRDIKLSPTVVVGAVGEAKTVIFDLMCTGESGEQFIVEIQRAFQYNFNDRLVFYNCRAISEQLPRGKLPVDYAINKTYSIAVLEFCLPDSPQNNYLHSASIVYRGSDKLFSNKQHYKIIELPRFKKISTELESDLDKWVFLLKHMRSIQHIPTILSHGVYKEALDIAEISNFTLEDYKMYRSSLQDEHDYLNAMAYAKFQAAREGREEGREEGRQEGLDKGKLTFVKTLIRDTDFDIGKIADLVGVEEDFVRRIRCKMKG